MAASEAGRDDMSAIIMKALSDAEGGVRLMRQYARGSLTAVNGRIEIAAYRAW
jgi:hypothetical protein